MSVGEQDHRDIAVPPAIALGRREQSMDFEVMRLVHKNPAFLAVHCFYKALFCTADGATRRATVGSRA